LPKYLKKANAVKKTSSEANKYSRIHEKKATAVSYRGLLKASTIEKALASNGNNLSQTLYLTVNDLWNASAAGDVGPKNDDDHLIAHGSFGINGESLNDLMQDFSPYGESPGAHKSFNNGQNVLPDKFIQIEAIEEKDEKAEQTTAKSGSRDDLNEDMPLNKRNSKPLENSRDYISQAVERIQRSIRRDDYYNLPRKK
jgi:hypothetical protein